MICTLFDIELKAQVCDLEFVSAPQIGDTIAIDDKTNDLPPELYQACGNQHVFFRDNVITINTGSGIHEITHEPKGIIVMVKKYSRGFELLKT